MPTDGLAQSEREALVDLLNFCRLADERLTTAEECFGLLQEARFGWEGATSLTAYAAESLARAEQAISTAETRAGFLHSIATRLTTTELRSQAVSLSKKMFDADGRFVAAEHTAFREIKTAFGWPTD